MTRFEAICQSLLQELDFFYSAGLRGLALENAVYHKVRCYMDFEIEEVPKVASVATEYRMITERSGPYAKVMKSKPER